MIIINWINWGRYKFIKSILVCFLLLVAQGFIAHADVIVDNGGSGTSSTGVWEVSGGTLPYGTNSLWSRDGATYTWSFNSQPSGTYRVHMWWSAWKTRASSINVSINHTGGPTPVVIDQSVNGGQWNILGEYDFGTSGSVTITAAYGSTVSTSADAVWFELISGGTPSEEVIIDNDGPGTSYSGGNWGYSSGANPYGGSSRAESLAGAAYTFQGSVTGDQEISLWWTYWSSRCSAVPVDIYDGTTLLDTVQVNQHQLDLAGMWNVLGTYSFSGTARVVIRAQNGCSACADAVKFNSINSYGIPEAFIDSILPNPAFEGDAVTLLGHGEDDGEIVSYMWDSSIDDYLGSDNPLTISTLSPGTHYITLKVVDNDGIISERVRERLVIRGLTDEPPLASIESVTPNRVSEGQPVILTGNGYDDWEVVDYRWESDVDGYLGNVPVITVSDLSIGEHIISLQVKDDLGTWSVPATARLVVASAGAEIIIDNRDAATSRTGTWDKSGAPNYYSVDSVWSRDGSTFSWLFNPPQTGSYEVSMWWTEWPSRSSNIPVRIEHSLGTAQVSINQKQNGGKWNPIGQYSFVAGNTYKVTVTSQSYPTSTCADAVRFQMGQGLPSPVLRHKWTVDVGAKGQIMPLMGDIDNDGTQEIVVAAGYNVKAINGQTGVVEWSVPCSTTGGRCSEYAPELVDLNKDGTPEILYGTVGSGDGPHLHALNGNGSKRWVSPRLGGDFLTLFPIIAHDIDGDGYPEIWFASEDSDPDPYSGDIDDYNGAITMLNSNGVVLRSTWIHHPCWGGMALADYNSDGIYELYLSDRRSGYHDFPALGLQAFRADTLAPIWSRPDIQHSSPMAIIADATGDGILDVIATMITRKGPMILDAGTGEDIIDYSGEGLPTHGTPTVYDLDGDGHLEYITASSYPSSAPKNFVVFDLVDGKVEFEARFNAFWVAWPPKVGDVTGDGHMEILVASGNQPDVVGDTPDASYPLIVYDRNYMLLDRIEMPAGTGQLTPTKVLDVDGDGYNEVLVAGYNGKIMVFDTDALTPNPAPRGWVQMYSEYRRGAAEYVPPPGN